MDSDKGLLWIGAFAIVIIIASVSFLNIALSKSVGTAAIIFGIVLLTIYIFLNKKIRD